MARVTGIGGVFFKARDAEALCAWYRTHLGMDIEPWGGVTFRWRDGEASGREGTTVWTIFPASSDYFGPGDKALMINYRVDDLADVLRHLREEGCDVEEKVDESEYGKFGWVLDPEGNKIELWQPPDGQ